ncbi:MAG: hypothetical protein AABX03_05150 [Nanoarchaeota archaeon]
MNQNISPLKMEYDGEVENLYEQFALMGNKVRTDPRTQLHSLRVILKDNEISEHKNNLIKIAKQEGYHVVSCEGELLLTLDMSKGEDVMSLRPFVNVHTLIFYTEPKRRVA